MSEFKNKIKHIILARFRRKAPYPLILSPSSTSLPLRGRVLFSYLVYPLMWPETAPEFDGHSNAWESREIARIFQGLGYQVEAFRWDDNQFIPSGRYDIVFDIYTNLGRLATFFDHHTIKILHCTGSDPYYQNSAELKRVQAVNDRRNSQYLPRRMVQFPEQNYKSLQIADACSLLGNEHTLSTYPAHLRNKFELIPVSASPLGNTQKTSSQYVPEERQFLWFFGSGAVHKGLDLVLEVFARNPNLVLNVVGDVSSEADFMQMYARELLDTPNIHYHGRLIPKSEAFQKICRDSFCFIAPTCSEGTSTAVVTCLQIGLYPIISRDTGVDLPVDCGLYLEECSMDEIEKAVISVYNLPAVELSNQIAAVQSFAQGHFSRQKFREAMENFISRGIDQHEARQTNNQPLPINSQA